MSVQNRVVTRTSGRLCSIDLLRFFAVLMVLARHQPLPDTGISWLNQWGNWLSGAGWMGVDLFFVLSGFLVGGLLCEEYKTTGRIAAFNFLIRRGFKIYPSFYLMLLATVGMRWLFLREFSWDSFLAEFCFLQNYFKGIWNHTWSLAVEEHFYLLLAIGMASLGPHRFVASAAVICLICPVWRWIVIQQSLNEAGTINFVSVLFPTHLRIDALLIGVGLAYTTHLKPRGVDLSRMSAIGLLGVGWIPFLLGLMLGLTSTWMLSTGLSFLSLGSVCIITGLRSFEAEIRTNPITYQLAQLGRHSYSIYLWHMPFQKWGLQWHAFGFGNNLSPWITYFVYILGSLLIGTAFSLIVERSFLWLREQIAPSRNPT